MKNLLLILAVSGLMLTGCSKNNVVPAPDAGTVVAGNYPLSFIELDSAGVALYQYVLPTSSGATTLSGLLTARRDSAAAVFLTQTIKITGQTDQTSVIGEIHLQAGTATSTGASYDMYLNNRKIGTTDGTSISIDATSTDATTNTAYRTVITAQKAK